MWQRTVSRRLLGIMVAGVVLVIAGVVGFSGPVGSFVGLITQPIQTVFSRSGNAVAGWVSATREAGSLESQNQQLKSEVAALRQQLSQDTEVKAQNDELRRQLNLAPLPTSQLLAAEVIGYQPDNFRQFITINRGSSDGLKPGLAVVEQGVLVGTIDSVGVHSAKVFLVIDPNFRVAALDQDQPDRPTGTLHGQIGNGLEMDNIAQTDAIKPGDTIVTSGLGGDIAKGLIIGHIQAVTKQDNGVFQTAQVSSDVSFSRLDIVYVVERSP